MAGFVDTIEQAWLDHFMNDGTYTPVATKYIALSTTTPTEAAGNFTEPSGNSYARVSTTAADWDAATGTAPATKSNGTAKSFPQATGSWGTVTYFGLFDASTNGNLLAFGQLAASKTIDNGDTASFAIGALVLKFGDPSDSY